MADWSEEEEQLFRDVGGEPMLLGLEGETEWNFGWFPVNPLIDPTFKPGSARLFSSEAKSLKGSGEGKTVLLYEAAHEVMGRHLDSGPQAIGDCVGWAFAGAVDLLACAEIVAGEAEAYDWEGRASTELSEVSIQRRLDRSGDGAYRLNGARCRLVDVVEVR